MAGRYNLGEANARIKVTTDTRDLNKADRAFNAFERTIRGLSGRLGNFERTMNEMESELNQVSQDFRQADRQAGKFDRTVDDLGKRIKGTRKDTQDWSIDIHELHQRMRGLQSIASDVIPPLLQVSRVMREFHNAQGGVFDSVGVVRFTKAMTRAGAVSSVITLLTSRFTGLGSALGTVTGHQRGLLRVAGTIQTFTFGATVLGALAAKTGLASKAFSLIANRSEGAGFALERTGHRIKSVVNNLDLLSKGSVQFIGGIALMRNGLNNLISRFGVLNRLPPIFKVALAGAFAIGPAAIEVLSKALVGMSNLLLGLADAAKQLAGGFLAVPGAVSLIVAAFGTLKAIVSPMKDQFKDLFKAKTPEEFAKAISELPDHLKPLGQVIAEILPKWRDLQKALQTTFVGGADKQLLTISRNYLPAISKGSLQVANSWRIAKDQVVAFLDQSETVTAVNSIFMDTAQTMNSLSDNIEPVLSGLRDIAVVGAAFIRDLTAGLPRITENFAEWARVNRENGQLLQWMQDAWQGVKDLASGIVDATKALWTLLTLFKTNNGENALSRFADAMERFNNAVQKSAASGILKQIGDAVRNMGTEKMQQLAEIFKVLWDTLKQVLPVIQDISTGFSEVMVPAIKLAAEIIQQVTKFLNDLGGGRVLGWILGIVAAFKLMSIVLGPLRNVIQIAIGAFTGFKGAQNIILGVAGTLENFGPAGKKASSAILNVGDSIAKWATRATLAIAGVLAVWQIFSNSQSNLKALQDSMDEAGKHADEFKDKLSGAFLVDRGLVGKNVFSTVQTQTETLLADLKATGEKVPGLVDNIVASFTIGDRSRDNSFIGQRNPFAQTEEFNQGQKAAQDAEKAKEAFDRLGTSTQDLTGIITGSQSIFNDFQTTLRNSGDGGNEAADQLQKLRDVFNRMQDDFERAGPGAALLAEGIGKIAGAAGDADTKLNGLKLALQGLGLDKTTAFENAIALGEAVTKLGTDAATAADKSQSLTDVWGPNGELNAGISANANNLFNLLSPAVEQLKRTAASGGDVQAAFQRIVDQVPALAAAFTPVGGSVDDTTTKIMNLISSIGGIPDTINLLVQLEGKDVLTQDLAAVVLSMQALAGKGVEIPVKVQDAKTVEAEIDKVLGPVLDDFTTSTDNLLIIKPDIDPSALATITKLLADHGIVIGPGTAPPGAQANIPIKPSVPPAALPTPVAPLPVTPPPAKPPIANLPSSVTPQAVPPIKIQTEGFDEAKGKFDALNAVIAASVVQWQGYQTAVGTVIQQIITGLDSLVREAAARFEALGESAQNAGVKFASDFASGIDSGAHLGIEAAERLAAAVRDRLPMNSPARKGPLSGSGWSYYGGTHFSKDFATGILAEQAAVAGAANSVAGAASAETSRVGSSTGPGGPGTQVGGFLGQLKQLISFGESIKAVFDQISDTVFSFIKFISDPLGKGTFFGQPKKFQRDPSISDKDLQTKREDALQAKLNGASSKDVTNSVADGVNQAFSSDQALLANIPKNARYSQKGNADLTKGLGDCSSAVEDLVNIMDGRPTGGRQMSTGNAASWLTEHGFQQGTGGLGDFRVAFNVEHMQATLPGGTPFNFGSDTAAKRGGVGGLGADDPKLNQHFFRPVVSAVSDALTSPINPVPVQPVVDPNAHLGQSRGVGPDLTGLTADEQKQIANNTAYSNKTQDEMLAELRSQTPLLDQAITVGQEPNSTDAQIADSLSTIQAQIDRQNENDTPAGRQQTSALEGVKSSIMQDRGFNEAPNPVDQVAGIAQGASGIASSVFRVIDSAIEAVVATKDINTMLIRGVSNTEDVMKMIDNFQKYIKLAADIAGAVSEISGFIGNLIPSGGDPFGGAAAASTAVKAVSAIAGMVQAALETTNAVIDIAQEAWHIFGSYFGIFLGQLSGGAEGALAGDVKYLLDQNANQLLAYSAENPLDKRAHSIFGESTTSTFTQAVGTINMYGGPGSDPRDNTRDMMFQVRAAQMAGALAQ